MAGFNEVAHAADVKPDVVKAVFSAVAKLAAKERVMIKGFGVFQVKTRPARSGRNIRTGETIQVPAKQVLAFRQPKK